jgi:hypothetical protein
MEFLIIPVGMIFGACNAPSWWDIMANWHSHLGTTKDYSNEQHDIIDQVQLVPDLTNAERAIIPPAIANSQNQGILDKLKHHGHISMFVDDNCSINIHSVILNDIRAAIGSACNCFGFPEEDHCLPCLHFKNFEITVNFIVFHLGFQICMCTMRLILPEQKCQALRELIESAWLPRPPHNSIRPKSPKDIAILLRHIRNSSLVFPLGNFILIRLTQLLTAAMKLASVEATTNKNWWN